MLRKKCNVCETDSIIKQYIQRAYILHIYAVSLCIVSTKVLQCSTQHRQYTSPQPKVSTCAFIASCIGLEAAAVTAADLADPLTSLSAGCCCGGCGGCWGMCGRKECERAASPIVGAFSCWMVSLGKGGCSNCDEAGLGRRIPTKPNAPGPLGDSGRHKAADSKKLLSGVAAVTRVDLRLPSISAPAVGGLCAGWCCGRMGLFGQEDVAGGKGPAAEAPPRLLPRPDVPSSALHSGL